MDTSALLTILIPIAVIQIVGWATPGPNHLTIITASVTAGRAAGIRAAFGIAAGALTWSLIAVSGIAVIFEVFPPLYLALRIAGAAYLIYLGINAFQAARRGGVFKLSPDKASPATKAPFRTAYLVMMTNPKAVLFFGSILTAFIPLDGSRALMIIIVLQIGTLAALLNTFAALFFSVGPVKRAFESYGYAISMVFGGLFCALGALVAWDIAQGILN